MIYLTSLAAVTVFVLVDRLDRANNLAAAWETECHAAEADLRPTRRGTPDPPWSPPASGLYALGAITAPTNADLWAWIDATNDTPALCTGRPRYGDPATCLAIA